MSVKDLFGMRFPGDGSPSSSTSASEIAMKHQQAIQSLPDKYQISRDDMYDARRFDPARTYTNPWDRVEGSLADGVKSCVKIAGKPGVGKYITVLTHNDNATVVATHLDTLVMFPIKGGKLTASVATELMAWAALLPEVQEYGNNSGG